MSRGGPMAVALTAALGIVSCVRPEPRVGTIPFVGCPADGQVGPIAAPEGAPRRVGHSPFDNEIAFYKGENARGAFGPRGWKCQVLYGSNGSTLLITPSSPALTGAQSTTIRGPAVQLSLSDGGTSGRFDVAMFGGRLFPRIAHSFVQQVLSEGIETAQELTLPSFSSDSIRYLDSLTVEFTTPAHSLGLGTQSRLDSGSDPIHGFVALDTTDDWAVTTLVTRLGPGRAGLDDAIRDLNLVCLRKPDGC